MASFAPAQPAVEWRIETVAGTGAHGFGGDGGPAVLAQLSGPTNVALDAAGNIYIADSGNHRIRRIGIDGNISTVAGTSARGFSGDGGPATQAQLALPLGVAVDGAGNIYIADYVFGYIRRVDAAGVISTVADGGRPTDVALDAAGNLYIAARSRIRKVNTAGVISTVAGTGEAGYSGDGGSAVQAQLNDIWGVAVDGAGNLFIADRGNNSSIRRFDNSCIRRVDAVTGIITTIAGNENRGFSGDGGPAVLARLDSPADVALDAVGNIYIADARNHRIRRVDAVTGIITTIAGNGNRGFSGDGGPAVLAQLGGPIGVALDAAENIYIADTGNDRIRRLTPIPKGTPRISAGGIVLATGTPVVNRISPNAIVSVFGREFTPEGARAESPALDAAGRVATELAGLCLEIDGKRAPLFAVFPGQINAQAPHDLTHRQTPVIAIRNCGAEDEQRSFAAAVEVAALSPAFFNFHIDAGGRNPIVALRGVGQALAGLPGAVPGVELVPAEPGEVVTFFGTGFGPTNPPLEAGQIPGGGAPITGEIEFAFGGITLFPEDVLYAGAAPCCAGLYQFTVRVPRGFPDSLRAPVVAAVNGVPTPEGPFLTVRRRE